jgi:DNA polymerase III subunit epsilon
MSLLAGATLLAVDTETTGFDVGKGERVVEVAYVKIVDGRIAGEWSSLVHPGKPIPPGATEIHRITDAMVAGAPPLPEVGRALREACADLPLVFHNAPFDLPFLRVLFEEAGVPPLLNPIVDTLGLARGMSSSGSNSLGALAARLKLPAEDAHRALGDTRTTARLFLHLAQRWEAERGVRSLAELAAASQDVMRLTARR